MYEVRKSVLSVHQIFVQMLVMVIVIRGMRVPIIRPIVMLRTHLIPLSVRVILMAVIVVLVAQMDRPFVR